MPLQPEIWEADIVGNLYKDNEFMQYATNADQHVVGGRAVHIPNANLGSNVVRNRTTLPATVQKRTDTDVVYALDEFTSDPILIPNIDNLQLSYDKRASVMAEDQATIKQVQADWLLYSWVQNVTANQIIRTTGAASGTTLAGATGNRKLFTKYDLLQAKIAMDNQLIPSTDRYALLSAEAMAQLLQDKDLAVNFNQYADLANGIVGNVYGFKLMMRPASVRFTNGPGSGNTTPAPKAPDAVTATDDNGVSICWHKSAVERALGAVKMFEQTNHPQFYGDVYSFLVMLGGRARRNDGKGIVCIVEAASA